MCQITEGLFNAERHDEGDTGGLRVAYRQAHHYRLLLGDDPLKSLSFEQHPSGQLDGAGLRLTDSRATDRQGESENGRSRPSD